MEPLKQPISNDRLQNVVESLSLFKNLYIKEKEECKQIRELHSKLEIDLKEARELEKSHRYHLVTSREMIGNLQETVSHLVYLKRDSKRLTEELGAKDATIALLGKEKESQALRLNESLNELRRQHEKQMEEIEAEKQKCIEQVRRDCDTQIAQFSCVIEELRAKIREIEAEHRDKINVVVLEYEEKLQRSSAQITQLHDQQSGLIARTDANIEAYRRKLEELEEKLKQSNFKQYLAQNSMQFETQVERPYSSNRDYTASPTEMVSNVNISKASNSQKPSTARVNPLQVTYYGNKTQSVQKEKGAFNITKKRKLYNDKDFQDF